MIEPIGRGVLDPPPSRGTTLVGYDRDRRCRSAPWLPHQWL